jgi:prohibitin 2
MSPQTGSAARVLAAGSIAMALVVALFFSLTTFDTVDPGERGIYVLFGEPRGEPLAEGLHWKNPAANIETINVRQRVYDQNAEASSSDLQIVHAKIAVNYRPEASQVKNLFINVGPDHTAWEDVLLRPAIQEVTKAVTAQFTAEALITKRSETKKAITEAIIDRLKKEHIIVSEVSITDFGFNKAFNDAIEAKQIAEQKAKQAENELRRVEIEAQQKVVQAKADKNARILQAQGEAEEMQILAKAEAAYQRAVGKAATPHGMRLRALQAWDGKMPQVVGEGQMLVDMGMTR